MTKAITDAGIDAAYAAKVIGHHILTMSLLNTGKLNSGSVVLFVGSESATGNIPMFSMPKFDKIAKEKTNGDVSAVMVALLRGDEKIVGAYSHFRSYLCANLFGVMWCFALSKSFSEKGIRVFATSPGNVPDTSLSRQGNQYIVSLVGFLLPYIVGALSPEQSAKERYLPFLDRPDSFKVGRFYASPPKKFVGPLTIQELPHFVDPNLAENILKAIEEVSGQPSL
jgi:hypothetical protein